MKYFNMIMSIICTVLAIINLFAGGGEQAGLYVVMALIFAACHKIDRLEDKIKDF